MNIFRRHVSLHSLYRLQNRLNSPVLGSPYFGEYAVGGRHDEDA